MTLLGNVELYFIVTSGWTEPSIFVATRKPGQQIIKYSANVSCRIDFDRTKKSSLDQEFDVTVSDSELLGGS